MLAWSSSFRGFRPSTTPGTIQDVVHHRPFGDWLHHCAEEAAGLTDIVPFLVEDSLKEAGARYSKGPDGDSYVVTDGTLVTGQNPASSADAARRLLDLLTH